MVTVRDADAWWKSLSCTISNKNPAKNGWGTFMHLTVSVSPSLVQLLRVFCFLEVVGDVGYRWCAIAAGVGFVFSKKGNFAADMVFLGKGWVLLGDDAIESVRSARVHAC